MRIYCGRYVVPLNEKLGPAIIRPACTGRPTAIAAIDRMSIYGSQLRRAVEKNQPPAFPLFCFAAIALVAVQMGWATRIDSEDVRALQAAMAKVAAPFYWVDAAGRSFAVTFALSTFGGLVVAGLFANQHAVRPRYAWFAFVIWGLAMTGGNLVSRAAPAGGFADAAGATWVSRSGPIEHSPWSAATKLIVGCDTKKRGVPKDRLQFDLEFGSRRARLVTYLAPERVGPWLTRIQPIVNAIPPDAEFSRTALNLRCIAHYSRDLSPEEARVLLGIFRPTADHARRISKESPAWGDLVRQVASESDRQSRGGVDAPPAPATGGVQ